MSRKSLSSIVLAVALIGAGLLGHRMRQAERAAELCAQARRLLEAPIEQASSLHELRATEALSLAVTARAMHESTEAAALEHLARAIARLQANSLDQAERALSKVPGESRASALFALVSLDLWYTRGQRERADAELARLLAQQPEDARVLLLAARRARETGRADRALHHADRALTRHPEAFVLHQERGLAHELLGNLSGARSDFEQAARRSTQGTAPLLHLGRVLRSAGELESALLAFASAVERNPQDPDAWLGSGLCRAARGDRVGARADFNHANELAPLRAEPILALGDLDAAENDHDSALRRYHAAIQLDPDNVAGHVKLGNAQLRAGSATAAIDAFRNAIDRAPDLAQAHNGLGAALARLGEADAAQQALSQAARLDVHDPNPLLNLAVLRKQRGDDAGAQAAFAEAQARDPGLALASLTVQGDRKASRARRP